MVAWDGAKDKLFLQRKPSVSGNAIQLRETCHSEAVTDVTAVGIRIQNVRENGLPRQSADWLAMTKPLTEWHWSGFPFLEINNILTALKCLQLVKKVVLPLF